MSNESFQINSQLTADSHELISWQYLHLRLHKNASLPWVIIIPETDVIEFCDLRPEHQLELTRIGGLLGQYFKEHFGVKKINFAAIGNVVQQLHIHVIGRHPKDVLWPDVVWGNELPEVRYTKKELSVLQRQFQQLLEDQA